MNNIILYEKSTAILLALKKNKESKQSPFNISQVANVTESTFSHTTGRLLLFKIRNLVTIEKRGRSSYISLTVKGYALSKLIEKIVKLDV